MSNIEHDTSLQLNLKKFIIAWNARYPIDRYIRKKYNLQFGSPEHRSLNMIDMMTEFVEDKLIQLEEQKELEITDAELERQMGLNKTKTDENQASKSFVKMSSKQVDDEFENLNIAELNKINL